MSKHVDLVNEAYAAFARGDIPAILELLDDHVDWSSPKTLPHGGHFSGRDGVLEFFQGIGAEWDSLGLEIEGVGEAGPDLVLARVSASGVRKGGGAAGYGAAHTFEFGGGKITSFREYVDLDFAL